MWQLFGTDVSAVRQNFVFNNGIRDLKWIYESTVGSISFVFDTIEDGPISICQSQGVYVYPKEYDFLEVLFCLEWFLIVVAEGIKYLFERNNASIERYDCCTYGTDIKEHVHCFGIIEGSWKV